MKARLLSLLLVALALTQFLSTTRSQGIAENQRRSGFDTMGPDTQAMQRNDADNPAMLWIREGERLWHDTPEPLTQDKGIAGKSCASCHGDATQSMKSVANRYPAFDEATARPTDLTGKILQCRSQRQQAAPLARESRALLGLTAYVGMQSRGEKILAPADPRLAAYAAQGKILFNQRLGQLNLSCAACHDDAYDKKLGGSTIPQGHSNGYPLYRLEWQNLGSLQRRLRNCLTGIRAEPYPYGDPALINLELYLKERSVGLTIETPAVRP